MQAVWRNRLGANKYAVHANISFLAKFDRCLWLGWIPTPPGGCLSFENPHP
jgi:hypothetical protein